MLYGRGKQLTGEGEETYQVREGFILYHSVSKSSGLDIQSDVLEGSELLRPWRRGKKTAIKD